MFDYHRRQTFKSSLRIFFGVRFRVSRFRVFGGCLGVSWVRLGIMSRFFNMDSKMNMLWLFQELLGLLVELLGLFEHGKET